MTDFRLSPGSLATSSAAMDTPKLSWTADGPVDRLIWKAVVRQGAYEIDHVTLAARFVRAGSVPATEAITHPCTNLEETQAYCEHHWNVLVRDPSESAPSLPSRSTSRRRRPFKGSRVSGGG